MKSEIMRRRSLTPREEAKFIKRQKDDILYREIKLENARDFKKAQVRRRIV